MGFKFLNRGRTAAAIALALVCSAAAVPARAAPVLLEDLELNESESAWEVRVLFAMPIRYLRHSPEREGAGIEVAVEPLGGVDLREALRSGPEVLQPSKQAALPLRDVRMELGVDGRPLLLLRFWREVEFRIKPGAEFRSLTVLVRKSKKKPAATAPAGSGQAGSGTAEEIMTEARQAMVVKQYDRAIALYTIILRSPTQKSDVHTREALEYLGLARQRNGQLTHARAEYEEYLARFPDGEGSDRVRQRLAALATARAAAPGKLGGATPRTPKSFDFYGSIYTSYFRTESFAELSGAELVDSSQLLDVDAGARMRRGSLDLRGRVSGYLRYDYDDGSSEVPSRVTRLYIEARDRKHQIGGILGRQSSLGAGVLSRFDGLTADWTFVPNWTLKGVAGFPQLSSVSNTIDTSQQMFGLSVEAMQLVDGLSAELYGVAQFADGMTDRAAFGVETRYLDERRTAYGLIDVDVYFAQLNIAMFSGSWRIGDATTLNVLVDYRYSPVLTAQNALAGQPFDDLGDLEDSLSGEAIKDLAEDRTPRVTTLLFGVSHRISPNVEINGDFTASQIGGTSASGGLPGYESSDWFFYYTAQLVSWNWLMEGGSERLGLRVFDGERYSAFSTNLSGRYPLPFDFRLTPELRFEYRRNRDTRDFVELDPGLRIEYRFRWFTLDADFILQWIKGVGSDGAFARDDELGYILNVGARFDF